MEKPVANNRLQFTFNKSSLYRVIKVDGIWGGLTPKSDIQMAVFTERLPIPDTQTIEIDELGRSTTLEQTGTTKGLIREVEATLTMPPQVARSIGEWLISQANAFDKMLDAVPEEQLLAALNKIKADRNTK